MSAKPKPSAVEQPDSQLCPTCKTTSKRSLVVCIDGTSNQFSIRNTNVVELYSRLIKDEDQRTFYNSGIGTYAKPHGLTFRQWIANKRDLAFAWRFDKVLLSAYRWLSENYEPGDRIFLFGFSRGAYQVRALSAMIRDVGLIHKGNQDQIPFAYQLYADPNSRVVSSTPLSTCESVKSYLYHKAGKKDPPETGSTVDPAKTSSTVEPPKTSSTVEPPKTGSMKVDSPKEEPINLADRFKTTFCRKDVKVHFVGVWDTVSSVGFVYGKTLPGTTDGMEHACFFRHALAIHERRVKFLPEFADTSNKASVVSSNAANTAEGARSSAGAGAKQNPTSGAFQGNEAPTLSAEPSGSNNMQSEFQTEQGTDESPRDDMEGLKKDATLDPQQPHIKEVWFAGSHSDIGGGNVPNASLDRFGPSLRWMSFESMLAGLKLGDDPRKWEGDPKNFKPYESLTGVWWILEILPMKQLSFLNLLKRDETVRRPHFGRWRRAFAGEMHQKLHETALEVIGLDSLHPKAEKHLLQRRELDPPGEANADHAYGPDLKILKWPDLDIESDPYYNALSFFRLLHTGRLTRASDIERFELLLHHASATPPGQKSIQDAIQELVDEDVRSNSANDKGDGEDKNKTRELQFMSRLQLHSEWGRKLLLILKEWDEKETAETERTRALRAAFKLFNHLEPTLSFPQSRDLRLRAKSFAKRGSRDSPGENFILLVNSVLPPDLYPPLQLLSGNRLRGIFSPDGKRVIVGFRDAGGCVVLDYSEMSPSRRLAKGDSVELVAVSGDSAFIAVALGPPRKDVITIWDAASSGDEPVHIVEHAPAQLSCFALSYDGTRLVAGCNNSTIVVWTKVDGWSEFASFTGRPNQIDCISWSRDDYVAAVSMGEELHIWAMGTGSAPTKLLSATVCDRVQSIAFAPTTQKASPIRIVVGARGGTFRLDVVKDVAGGYRVQVTKLSGRWTWRASISPDGKYIASIMDERMIWVWDADSCEIVCNDIGWPDDFTVEALSFEEDDTAVKAFCRDKSVRLFCWE